MKEELEHKANQILLDILNQYDPLKEFVIEQTPMVVQEILAYNFWVSLVSCLVLPMMALVLWTLSKASGFYRLQDSFANIRVGQWITITISVVLLVIFTPLVVGNNLDWLQIWLAPKLYLLEYARGLK